MREEKDEEEVGKGERGGRRDKEGDGDSVLEDSNRLTNYGVHIKVELSCVVEVRV